MADAIHVLQRELDVLLVGDVHTRDTCCLHPQGSPLNCGLRYSCRAVSGRPKLQQQECRSRDTSLQHGIDGIRLAGTDLQQR